MAPIEIVLLDRRGRALAPACRRLIRRLLARTRRREAGLTLLLAGDLAVRRLNRRFLGADRTTDVLSFPWQGDREPGQAYLGEIAISVPRAARQARRARWALRSEIALLVTHGFLHLLGYDHERDDGTMRRLERAMLLRLAGVALEGRGLPWGEANPEGGARRSRRTGRTGHG